MEGGGPARVGNSGKRGRGHGKEGEGGKRKEGLLPLAGNKRPPETSFLEPTNH